MLRGGGQDRRLLAQRALHQSGAHARLRAVRPDRREADHEQVAGGVRRPEVDLDQHGQAAGRVPGRRDGQGQGKVRA